MSKESGKDFSRAFYPFLHADERKPGELLDELGFSLLEKARESVEVKSKFFAENKETILAASAGRPPTRSTWPSSSCTRSPWAARRCPPSA
jgi:hypothetical protein